MRKNNVTPRHIGGGGQPYSLSKNNPLVHKLGQTLFIMAAALVFILLPILLLLPKPTPQVNAVSSYIPAAADEPQSTFDSTVEEFDEDNAADPKFADIYKITNAETGEIDFHIKTPAGFLKLSEATENGQAFDPKWTFLLDNDINLAAVCNNFTMIGGEDNPFICTFDGQNHTITYAQKGENGEALSGDGSLFNYLDGNATIKNIHLIVDINTTKRASGLMLYWSNGKEIDACGNITHVLVEGSIVSNAFYGIVFSVEIPRLNLYDVNVNFTKLIGGSGLDGDNFYSMFVGYFSNLENAYLNINSCSIICPSVQNCICCVYGMSYAVTNFNINATNLYIDVNYDVPQGLPLFLTFGAMLADNIITLVCTECEIHVSTSNAVIGTCLLLIGRREKVNVSIYDSIFATDTNQNPAKIFMISDDISDEPLFTDYPSQSLMTEGTTCTYYYSGLYKYNFASDELVNINPYFTNAKWCQHPDLNNGLPMLRCFTWLSDYLNDFNMQSWAQEQ